MPTFGIKLKWNKQVFEDVEVDPSKGAQAFKEQLYQLTGVPPERQKVMAKGLWKGTLKDDQELTGLDWTDGILIAMMGSSTGIPKPPAEKTVFVEDLSTSEKQKVAAVDPPGLVNLGNTCYMNATVQCLRAVPEFREALEVAPITGAGGDTAEAMTVALRDLYKDMDRSDDYVTPSRFVQTMRLTFPQFAQTTPKGGFAQQDADEFFNELLSVMSSFLVEQGKEFKFEGKRNAVEALFGIDMSTEMRCIESDDEPVSRGTDLQRRLQCNITSDTVTLEQGIQLGLESELEKNASTLGRNALFKQTRRIRKLPKYLTVQENRFFWKRTPESRDHQGVNCKILKSVKFSTTLDIFDFCDDELQKVLKGPRDEHLRNKMGREQAAKDGNAMEEDDEELQAALRMSMADPNASAGIGIPPGFRGIYELFGVVTHKGRASDSGHYIGWVKQDGKEDDWVCFDDETASHCKTEDILLLSGGGDRSMCYLCFYRAKE